MIKVLCGESKPAIDDIASSLSHTHISIPASSTSKVFLTLEANRAIIEEEPEQHGVDGMGLILQHLPGSDTTLVYESGKQVAYGFLRNRGLFAASSLTDPKPQSGDVFYKRRGIIMNMNNDGTLETKGSDYGNSEHVGTILREVSAMPLSGS